ncbi:uncharacterized protein BP5553_03449 [Venustampulla echinocandica]|uniref:chitinase n=1 Tax=Venustampulla echinocandica TaxID=2656787 RepID=A0A370TUB1_9HELO|nr:uncharacterized protein BP5553_03449 [Venustampulla echinocandica]RDL39109.1 hypothetical protein BP5553_03449 [Venustampulla echinocandica]
MNYHYNLLLSILSLIPLICNSQLAYSACLHSPKLELVKKDVSAVAVPLPGLEYISQYVCPTSAIANEKRQVIEIHVTKDQLEAFLFHLRAIEMQIVAAINSIFKDSGFTLPAGSLEVPEGTGFDPGPAGPTGSPGSVGPVVLAEQITTLTFTVTRTTTMTVTRMAGMTAKGSMLPDVAAPSTAVSPQDPPMNQEIVAASSTAAPLHGSLDGSPGRYTRAKSSLGTISQVVTFSTGARAFAASTATIAPTNNGKTNSSPQKYVFDPQSTKNVAVYYGQTPATGSVSLEAQCADPNVDIVILAFIISQLDRGKYPAVNFGAACGGQTAAMASQAPGLLSCPQLAQYISACQSRYGKKVLLSIGGATSGVIFASDAEAMAFADVLWQLFGPPGSIDIQLRPFGEVVIDGFDFDNENNNHQSYPVVASRLRTHFATSKTPQKTYYLSSAPQCPFPDASNPLPLLLLLDWVWVQFYNNPPCEIGSSGFAASVKQWDAALQKSSLSVKPRLYIGAPAWGAAGPGAYNGGIKSAKGIVAVLNHARRLGVKNFGGAMFWDGPQGEGNVEGGKSILAWAKDGLN